MLSALTKASALRPRGLATLAGHSKVWRVYLSGEIHSSWREDVAAGIRDAGLSEQVSLCGPNASHEDSDDCAAIILGMEEKRPNWDRIGASMNAIRTRTLIDDADVVVVRLGEKYRQWNAAFDAGYASAKGKPIITLHPPSLGHPMKEVNAAAMAVCEEVVQTLAYVISGDAWEPIADRLGKGNPNP